MNQLGISPDIIARVLNISRKTVTRHCRDTRLSSAEIVKEIMLRHKLIFPQTRPQYIVNYIINYTIYRFISFYQMSLCVGWIGRSRRTVDTYIVPERKVTFRQNPNIETRNSKQIRIPNDRNESRHGLRNTMFLSLEHFHFCHCFGFRIFDRKPWFSVKHYIADLRAATQMEHDIYIFRMKRLIIP